MSSADRGDGDDLYEQLRALVGQQAGPPRGAPDAVNEAMIRHWCEAMGDTNPVYTDPAAAASSVHGGLVAPPTMLQAWVMSSLHDVVTSGGVNDADAISAQIYALCQQHGVTGVVATDCRQTYARYLRPGDRLTMRKTIEDVSPRKATALGEGYFITTRQDYVDADGELVGSMHFRVLRFRPKRSQREAMTPRPRPATTPDNAWWFDALRDGRLQVQQCTGCQAVHHPPSPMCPRCRGLDWKPIDVGRAGRVHSFARVHHPDVPGFEYPLDVLLVDVDVPATGDTVRMVMNPARPNATFAIGTEVRVVVQAADDDLSLPFAELLGDGG